MFDASVGTNGGGVIEAEVCGTGAVAGDRCDQLHRRLKRIVKARGLLDLQEAEALREAQKIRIWRRFGHSSLLEYLEREMGYAPRVAQDRLRVANALPDLPKIAEAMANGDLNFSGARELTRVATPETEGVWLGAIADKNVREVEAAVSGHTRGDLPTDAPDPRLQRETMWFSVPPEIKVLFRECRQKLEKERGERLEEHEVLAAAFRLLLGSSAGSSAGTSASTSAGTSASTSVRDEGAIEREERIAGAAPYRVAVTVCKDCKRGWQHGGGAVVELSPPAIARAQCDAQEIGDVNSGSPKRATQTIPPATRRAVKHRDQGKCRVPGCRCYTNIDIHHRVPRSEGGTHEMSNLITLCEGHHLALHDGTLTIEFVNGEFVFQREGRNRYTRATREIETKAALKARGFGRDAVREIMMRTHAHVGASDLTGEQWLAIALGYAEAISRPS